MTNLIISTLSEDSENRVVEKVLARLNEKWEMTPKKSTEAATEQTFRGARDAAGFLRISTGTFQQLKNEGKIKPSYIIGSTNFYTATDLRNQIGNLYK